MLGFIENLFPKQSYLAGNIFAIRILCLPEAHFYFGDNVQITVIGGSENPDVVLQN